MTSLQSLFENHTGRSVCKWVHYIEHYERHFARFVGKPVNILEIGVENGGSLQLWKRYFGQEATIVGVDIDKNRYFTEDQITVEIGDQTDLVFLKKIIDSYGSFDIIIDDGSHKQKDIKKTFEFLYHHLAYNGVYVIEDLHCAYFSSFQGGVAASNNFVQHLSKFVDDINFRYIREFFYNRKLVGLKSLCFYDSMAFIEKEPDIDRFVEVRGKGIYKKLTPKEIFE